MLLVVSLKMVTLVLLVVAQDDNKEFHAGEDKSLAQSLRRQLMIDNYDYSHEATNSSEKENSNNRRKAKKTRKNFYVSDLNIEEEKDTERNIHSKDYREKNDQKNVENVVSKKDLVHYNDDENVLTDKSVNIESTARYKLLKVRHQFRRSGQSRLIREENKEGVAIVNLDNGPFPELRLPNSRRQYMQDHGEAMTDEEEVPPPAVNTSDPEAAAEEVENLTELAAVSTTNKLMI